MFQPHMGHHQATFYFLIGETTALYTVSSVPLGTSVYLRYKNDATMQQDAEI
jgi:hypothetical protein